MSKSDAVRHALAAEDFERAAGLIARAWPAMLRSSQDATWLGWVRALPDEMLRAKPALSAGYIWALLVRGELEAADARLRDAERWLDATTDTSKRPEAPSAEMVVVDEEEFRFLPATIATARTFLAQALGDETERVYTGGVVPNVRPVAARKTRVWVAQGRLTEALSWVSEQDLSADDDLSYLSEFEHITLARVLLARYKSDRVELSIHEAVGLLERLLKAAEEGGRMGSVIEILVLQALVHEAKGDISSALDPSVTSKIPTASWVSVTAPKLSPGQTN